MKDCFASFEITNEILSKLENLAFDGLTPKPFFLVYSSRVHSAASMSLLIVERNFPFVKSTIFSVVPLLFNLERIL